MRLANRGPDPMPENRGAPTRNVPVNPCASWMLSCICEVSWCESICVIAFLILFSRALSRHFEPLPTLRKEKMGNRQNVLELMNDTTSTAFACRTRLFQSFILCCWYSCLHFHIRLYEMMPATIRTEVRLDGASYRRSGQVLGIRDRGQSSLWRHHNAMLR